MPIESSPEVSADIHLTFSMDLRVFSPETLIAKAKERARAEGANPEDIRTAEEAVVMLLDPATVPGCEVEESYVERHPAP